MKSAKSEGGMKGMSTLVSECQTEEKVSSSCPPFLLSFDLARDP
jgi:hypothetical protein